MKKIVMAVDGSKYSDAAVKKAGELAEKFGYKVTLINVIKPMTVFHEQEKLVEILQQEEAEDILKKSKGILNSKGIDSKTLFRRGDPGSEIINLAKEDDADMIVIGSRGLSGVKMFLMGSVSIKVMEHAPCSVLVVRGRFPKET